jgi:hypothetical protein
LNQTAEKANKEEDSLNEEEYNVLTKRQIKENQKKQELEAMKGHPFYIGKAVKM